MRTVKFFKMGNRNSFMVSESSRAAQGKTSSDYSVYEAPADFDFQIIPEELIISVLSYVPDVHLIKICRLVCKQWKDIIDGHSVWKLKCDRQKLSLPLPKPNFLPEKYYQNIYLHYKYAKNLIKNACGEGGYDGWVLTRSGGDGFAIEHPPQGSDPVPGEVGTQVCFATSYDACEKHQMIDLYEEEYNKYLLQDGVAKITVGEWYAARFDCASVYKLHVYLLDEKNKELDQFQFEYKEEQWTGKAWHKVTHTFEDVTKARYIYFEDYGSDSQFWAGHYGSKMTGAFVKLTF